MKYIIITPQMLIHHDFIFFYSIKAWKLVKLYIEKNRPLMIALDLKEQASRSGGHYFEYDEGLLKYEILRIKNRYSILYSPIALYVYENYIYDEKEYKYIHQNIIYQNERYAEHFRNIIETIEKRNMKAVSECFRELHFKNFYRIYVKGDKEFIIYIPKDFTDADTVVRNGDDYIEGFQLSIETEQEVSWWLNDHKEEVMTTLNREEIEDRILDEIMNIEDNKPFILITPAVKTIISEQTFLGILMNKNDTAYNIIFHI